MMISLCDRLAVAEIITHEVGLRVTGIVFSSESRQHTKHARL